MAASQVNPLRFRIDNVRAAFTDTLFKAEQFNGEGKFRCGVSLLVEPEHPQMKQIREAIAIAMNEKWGRDPKVLAANKKSAESKDKLCLRDGDLKPKYAGFPGNFYISANCKGGDTEAEAARPTVYDAARNKVTEPGRNPIYSGCYVNALVEFYADDRFGAAVNATLVGIQFRKDGDAFGSAPAKEDDFEDVTEGATADDFA